MNYYNSSPQQIPINPDQFRQIAPNLSQSFLEQLIKQAREKGSTERDIENGLNFIKSIK